MRKGNNWPWLWYEHNCTQEFKSEKDHWSAMVPAQINILYKIFVKPKDFFYLNFVSKQSHFYMFKAFLIFS